MNIEITGTGQEDFQRLLDEFLSLSYNSGGKNVCFTSRDESPLRRVIMDNILHLESFLREKGHPEVRIIVNEEGINFITGSGFWWNSLVTTSLAGIFF